MLGLDRGVGRLPILVASTFLLCAGCGSSSSGTANDAGLPGDAASDAARDAAPDTSPEAAPDAAPDAPPADAGGDSAVLSDAGAWTIPLVFGGNGGATNAALAVDGKGNIDAVGAAYDFSVGDQSFKSTGGVGDGFLVSVTAKGALRWIRKFAQATVNDVAVDAAGNVTVVGIFDHPTVDCGTGALTNHGSFDMFVASYAPDGTPRWAHAYGGAGNDRAHAVAVRGDGAIAVTGSIDGSVDFGGGALTPLQSKKSEYLLRLSASGAFESAVLAQGGISDAFDVAFDPAGGVATAGYMMGTVDFGGGPIKAALVDLDVVAYDGAGKQRYASHFATGDASISMLDALTFDAGGNAYAAGGFRGGLTIGTRSYSAPDMGQYSGDAVVFSLDPSGAVRWARAYGSPSDDTFHALAFDAGSNRVIADGYMGTPPRDDGDGLLGGTAFIGLSGFIAAFDPGTGKAAGFELEVQDPTAPWAPADGAFDMVLDAAGTPTLAGQHGLFRAPPLP